MDSEPRAAGDVFTFPREQRQQVGRAHTPLWDRINPKQAHRWPRCAACQSPFRRRDLVVRSEQGGWVHTFCEET